MQNLIKIVPIVFSLLLSTAQAEPPKNFSKAKRVASKLFASNPYTLYCRCPYDKYKKIDLKACGMSEAKRNRI